MLASTQRLRELRRRQLARLTGAPWRPAAATPEAVRAAVDAVAPDATRQVLGWHDDLDGDLVLVVARALPRVASDVQAALAKLDPETPEFARLRDRCAEMLVILTLLPTNDGPVL